MSEQLPERETHVAIQGVCAWPNLKKYPDGTIVATIFNQPCHGHWEGDLDCYASEDGGFVWRYRGRPCEHEPGTARMNCATGFDHDGNHIVLCSGWDNRAEPYGESKPFSEAKILRAVACRSSDQSRTWERIGEFCDSPVMTELVPYGDIFAQDDGSLRAVGYGAIKTGGAAMRAASHMMISHDGGVSWAVHGQITTFGNETAILPLGDGKWLAAARTTGSVRDNVRIPVDPNAPIDKMARMVVLHRSDDDGKTWRYAGPVTMTGQIPAHLLMMDDGRIVLSYGNRCPHNLGVDVCISHDGGNSWGIPIRLADMMPGDGGYPSTVHLGDGRMVTAFYNKVSGNFHREMSVTRWDINALDRTSPDQTFPW